MGRHARVRGRFEVPSQCSCRRDRTRPIAKTGLGPLTREDLQTPLPLGGSVARRCLRGRTRGLGRRGRRDRRRRGRARGYRRRWRRRGRRRRRHRVGCRRGRRIGRWHLRDRRRHRQYERRERSHESSDVAPSANDPFPPRSGARPDSTDPRYPPRLNRTVRSFADGGSYAVGKPLAGSR
jgi:hypothetical protein